MQWYSYNLKGKINISQEFAYFLNSQHYSTSTGWGGVGGVGVGGLAKEKTTDNEEEKDYLTQ